jgi:shikimate dehydrogenase
MDCLRMGHYRGMNVGFPYRRLAAEEADYTSPDARAAGAANVLVREETHLSAYNTEGFGALYALERMTGNCLTGASLCIFGAGSTARAIASSALSMRVNDVVLFSHDISSAQAAVKKIQNQYPDEKCRITSADYSMLGMIVPFSDVIINDEDMRCFSLKKQLQSEGLFKSNQLIMDTDFKHGNDTPILNSAKKSGCVFYNGMEMFIEQAVLSVKIWAHILGLHFEVDRGALRVALNE